MMKKFVLFVLFISCFTVSYGQTVKTWTGHFSYFNTNDVQLSGNKVYTAAENAYYSIDVETNVVKKISSIEGLSGDVISKIHHSERYNKTIVAYQNGLIIIVDEADGSTFYLMGIIEKSTIPGDKKRINHMTEYGNLVYLSTDYGITVLNLDTNQFGDTYFIGSGGSTSQVLQTTISGDKIYAVSKNQGVFSALITNPFLVDYNQWTLVQNGNWVSVIDVKGKKIISDASANVYELESNNSLKYLTTLLSASVESKYVDGKILFTTVNSVYVFDENMLQIKRIDRSVDLKAPFVSSVILGHSLYVGTKEDGLKKVFLDQSNISLDLTPNGPQRNKIFRIEKSNNTMLAVYGGYDQYYNAHDYCCGGPSSYGISKLENDTWKHIGFDNLLQARALTSIAFDPKKKDEYYIASYFSGLLKMKDDQAVLMFNSANSPLTNESGEGINYLNPVSFDVDGNLWMTCVGEQKSLYVLKKDGQWGSYSFFNQTANTKKDRYSEIVIDKNGTKWVGTYRNGLVAFNEKYNKFIILGTSKGKGNLPHQHVKSIAVDLNNQLWIGTFQGIRVLPNINSYLTENVLDTKQIIILENTLAQELFYQSNILDIEVDGANNKWVSVENSGVFLISPDGQVTKAHFTKENSPLPSNDVDDIEIDGVTGEVYFVTSKGMVSYKGVTTAGTANYDNTFIYPNPYRPEHKDTIKITGLKDKSNVKVTDIEGNLVFEAISQGGTVEWDTRSFSKQLVSSGVYLVLISDKDAEETAYRKLLIVR